MDMKTIKQSAKSIQPRLLQTRRFLHAHAETGFAVTTTQAYIRKRLTELGYTPRPMGKNGTVAEIGTGKTLLLRADVDALPIQEKTGLPFACLSGNMHACGHDFHATMLLGAAELCKRHEKHLKGKIRFLFQPAEEVLLGANDCVENGVLDGVDGAVMLHVLTALPMPVGTCIIAEGTSAPSADYFTVKVQGKACHGAAAQNGVDALTIGARILLALEELIAKETPACARAKLTVGKMYGGESGNALAGETTIEGTLRAYGETVRADIKRRIDELAKGIAKTFRGKAKCTLQGGCPALINDREMVKLAYATLRRAFAKNKVLLAGALQGGVTAKSGGSEDFSYIAQRVPSVMIGLCAGNDKDGYVYPLHHEKADFDERVLWKGALAYAVFGLKM